MPDELDLQRQLDKLCWRLDALDVWRNGTAAMPGMDARVAVLESEIVTEREARMLREALNANTAQQGKLRLTRWQTAGAGLVGLVAVADFLRSLVMG